MALSVGHAFMIVAAVVVCVIAFVALGIVIFIAGMALLVRTWDGNTKR
jgi:hypothetical protein